ncbi:MAG: AbrB/MazE/SpoVT family DNA-binding domain-containing protein [Kiloniellales bacterium]|nr:AbrB/MazE/SpoVT family DNA-binding domain-containing protein [Kiloniellales bacterium]
MSGTKRLEGRARLTRQGNSTGVTLTKELLNAAGLERGDEVLVTAERGTGAITIRRADDVYTRAMAAGRAFARRYRRTMAALAR